MLCGADVQYCDSYWARVRAADRGARAFRDASEEARPGRLRRVEDRERFVPAAAVRRRVVAPGVAIAPEELRMARSS